MRRRGPSAVAGQLATQSKISTRQAVPRVIDALRRRLRGTGGGATRPARVCVAAAVSVLARRGWKMRRRNCGKSAGDVQCGMEFSAYFKGTAGSVRKRAGQ